MTGLLLASAVWAQDVSDLVEAERKMAARDFEGALAAYDKVIEGAPGDARGHAGRAEALNALGRLDEALAAFTRAIEIAPGGAYFYQRGMIHLARGDEDAARADFTKGMEIDPGRAILHRVSPDLLKRRYDYTGALRDYSRAYELDPDDINALERRAQTKEALRDFEGAVADYTLVAEAVPDAARPLELRGNAKARLGDLKGAIADYDAALGKDERNAGAWIGRARARLALGEKEAADADARKSAQPGARAGAFSDRGLYWYDTHRFNEAVEDLAEAVKRDPDGQDYARLYLFLARAKLGEREAAAAELKAYAEIRPTKGDWYSRVAAFLCGALNEEDLLAAAREGNEHRRREEGCEARWYAGAIRLLDGDAAGAKALFERCVATDVRTFVEYESAKMALAGMGK
jgi:tetratricopeptide (TPR) repeat protein